jgi:hypothetical protein
VIRNFAGKQGLGGLMTVGKSRAKVYVETDTKVTFKDVAGVDEAKFELQEIVFFLKNPKSFASALALRRGSSSARPELARHCFPARSLAKPASLSCTVLNPWIAMPST